jgi:hypothetical protein
MTNLTAGSGVAAKEYKLNKAGQLKILVSIILILNILYID